MASRGSNAAPEVAVTISTTPPEARYHDPASSKGDGSNERHMSSATAHSANDIARRNRTGLSSEHGHSLSYIRPMTQHPGSSVAAFFKGRFTTVIGISTLGASVTFSYVLSGDATNPRSANPVFDLRQTQLFLAISWLLFLLALANASLCSTLLTFFKYHWIADWDGVNGKTSQFEVQIYAVSAAALMGALIVGAFVLLSLVVAAYSAIIGWAALGFTAFYGLIIAVGVLQQVPWSWRSNTPTPGANHSEC
ncbi:hypothetical protein CLCR_07545 [Cladophialophora carrionii]|uniref:Uncharacterized protein n=1 Tax=Cladophialophora carrionii TaxID=86049 RepID=A0A1C1CNW0_9EURO|nr:hypothetical protein CLCR_07545 [Cladophialophora carrionii]